ncbi:MAG: 4-alpha-glucanotransferase [Candidatus Omnitrophica bacterium]|nr:4-alpha-glucanotransferase [Candidatus Omnitrophota bacterium]
MPVNEILYSTLSGNHWRKIGLKKKSGILVPLFSVHSSQSVGMGDFFDLKLLVDLCVKTKNSILQILPLNYAGYDNCPYNAISSFAIDPVYISISNFSYREKTFSKDTIKALLLQYVSGRNNRCDYRSRNEKLNLLKGLFEDTIDEICSDSEFFRFIKLTEHWLDDFAVYQVLKWLNNGAAWYDWDKTLAQNYSDKIDEIKHLYKKEILFHKWIQFICYKQLCEVKKYAKEKKVFIMGDLPILASRDSADVWAERDIFNLEFSAGAPPDMYCAYGQRWGMPVLNREKLRENNHRYLIERIRYLDNFFDMIRIDHVVGFFRIWAIPFEEPEENYGLNGFFIPEDESVWKDYGKEILSILVSNSNSLLCAEDLGIIPSVCTETLRELGIPGYEVLRWKKNYGSDYSFIHPLNYRDLAISTLSTHDTSFWIDWWEKEAGTIDSELFYLKCENMDLDAEKILPRIFENTKARGRLKWKKEVYCEKKLLEILSVSEERARDILLLYRDTYGEKEKLALLLGQADSYLKKAIDLILKGSSVFCINLLPDLLCLDSDIASSIASFRINKPGTQSEQNWSFAFEQPLEKMMEMKVVAEIREIIENSGR